MATIVIDTDLLSPTVADLATLCRARTRDDFAKGGSFTDKTSPNVDQANALIDLARLVVSAELGSTIPDRLSTQTSTAVLYYAAMELEASYYPEQASDADSVYEIHERRYNALISALKISLRGDGAGTPGANSFFSLPVTGRDGYLASADTPWLI